MRFYGSENFLAFGINNKPIKNQPATNFCSPPIQFDDIDFNPTPPKIENVIATNIPRELDVLTTKPLSIPSINSLNEGDTFAIDFSIATNLEGIFLDLFASNGIVIKSLSNYFLSGKVTQCGFDATLYEKGLRSRNPKYQISNSKENSSIKTLPYQESLSLKGKVIHAIDAPASLQPIITRVVTLPPTKLVQEKITSTTPDSYSAFEKITPSSDTSFAKSLCLLFTAIITKSIGVKS